MVKRDVFLMKPKPQYYLSQWGECAYVPNHEKKWRLFCESMFVKIDQRTLILKMVKKGVFLGKPKHQFIYTNEENEFVVLNL